MYNFALHINSDPSIAVHPVWPDSVVRNYDKENGEQFYRNKLSGKFTFVRSEFDTMLAAPFDARFRLVIERNDNPSVTFWEGYFHKTDCSWDEDSRLVEVQPITLDLYDDILGGVNKEYNLLDLFPETDTVIYKKQPLIQIYLSNSDFVTNFLSGVWWEQPVIERITGALLPGYYFGFDSIPNTAKNFIAGDDLVPDVSGSYIQDGVGGTERDDGAYGFIYQDIGNGGDQWTIVDRNDSDTVVYVGNVGEPLLFPTEQPHGSQDNIFLTSLTSSSRCRIFYAATYARYLTNELEVNGTPTQLLNNPNNDPIINGVPTNLLPNPDITSEAYGYTRVLELEINELIGFGGNSSTPDRFRKFNEDAINNSGEYFTKPTAPGGRVAYPLVNTEWTEVSWWFYYTDALRDLQEDGSKDVSLRHAYPLSSVIKVLLGEISPNTTYEETTVYSDFLNNLSGNPVSGDKYVRLFITPKTNIKKGDYDHPAETANIKFSSVMNMLKSVYQLHWHIDENDRFRLEHISWYMNGGSYSTVNVGYDLTQLIEAKTRKRWSFKSKKYVYDKLELPDRIISSWMDKGSLPFDGFNIDITSTFVQKGEEEERRVDLFTTDIDFVQTQPGSISDDGFMLIAASKDIDDNWSVNFKELTADGNEYKIQNGELSNIHLHPSYHKHNLPAPDVTINNDPATATTVKRYKSQEITFPVGTDPDPMQLIETDLGQGKLDKLEINLVTSAAKATIKHDQ